jgi:hypothetical protein
MSNPTAHPITPSEKAIDDAAFLNRLGVVAEMCGDWVGARKMYQRALRTDRSYLPAEQNLRRYFEIFTYGQTRLPIAGGVWNPSLSKKRVGYNRRQRTWLKWVLILARPTWRLMAKRIAASRSARSRNVRSSATLADMSPPLD